MKIEEMSFEAAVKRLEEVASALEREGVSLDESLKLYEEGVKLIRYCNGLLEGAERKIKILSVSGDGELTEQDFAEKSEA